MTHKKKRSWLKILGYVFLFLFIAFIILVQIAGQFMSKSEAAQQKILETSGLAFKFENYTFQNKNVHYVQVGFSDHLPTLIFVHGSPGGEDAYLDYLCDVSLAEKANMIAVDRPGFGLSDPKHPPKNLAEQSASLQAILERNKQSPNILVGHSLGGPLVAQMTMDFPDLVQGMIMLAPSIDPELEPAIWWRKIVNFPLLSWLCPRPFFNSNLEIMNVKPDLEAMLPRWKNIDCPVIVFQGGEDGLVPKENADFAVAQMPQIEVEKIMFPSEGHLIIWTQKEAITEKVLQFLNLF